MRFLDTCITINNYKSHFRESRQYIGLNASMHLVNNTPFFTLAIGKSEWVRWRIAIVLENNL